jgi:inner membrane protein
MPPISHALMGWCFGNALLKTPKARFAGIIASMAPDVDGLVLFHTTSAYLTYHHVVAHNLVFGCLVSAALSFWSGVRVGGALVYLALFHLHLITDLFGSGPGWGISYLWPLSPWHLDTKYAWEFVGWQNYTAFACLGVWSLVIAVRKRRTPLEYVAPRLEALIFARFAGSKSTRV